MDELIRQRINLLRKKLKEYEAQWYLSATADPHNSEYINDHYKEREFLSGFTGSAGTLLVGDDIALLWTDGRYFVQAVEELMDTGVILMREGDAGVPDIYEYLENNIPSGDVLLADGKLISCKMGRRIRECLKSVGASLKVGKNLVDDIWTERPEDSANDIRLLPTELYGQEFKEKITNFRDAIAAKGAVASIISGLDEQMWLFNLRGSDILYNPVAYAYTVVTDTGVSLYVKERAVSDALCRYAEDEDITLKAYEDFYKDLPLLKFMGKVLIDPDKTNYLICRILERSGTELIESRSPLDEAKAVKTPKEIGLLKDAYLKDSAALTRFLKYVKESAVKDNTDEYSLGLRLDSMRAQIKGFNDLSFTTISAFGPNAAMMHYEAPEEGSAKVAGNGFYLVDSGAQYDGGTTDVTRTLVIGNIEDVSKKHFTRVVAGMLALQNAVFLKGCGGRNLDILARGPVWEMEMDYKCGTGHGVGYMLNVHEGPAAIRWKQKPVSSDYPLEPGMLMSDEPGVYIAERYGIRIENILLCVRRTENGDGEFLAFEPLTWVPIDRDAIKKEYLEPKELKQLNEYHAKVREKLMPFMENEDERAWLIKATAEI